MALAKSIHAYGLGGFTILLLQVICVELHAKTNEEEEFREEW